MKKKLICLALSVVMLLSILPIAIFATEETTASITEYGTTTADWYTVGTAEELNYLLGTVFVKANKNLTFNIRLTENIDYTAEGSVDPVTTMGWEEYLKWDGIFDGQNHTITGLKTALLPCLGNGSNANNVTIVKDVTIVNSTLACQNINAGLAMGVWNGTVTIENVHVKGVTLGDENSAARIGGLISVIWGRDGGTLNVNNCSVTDSTFTITKNSGVNWIGGMVGALRINTSAALTYNFNNCVADVDITNSANNYSGYGGSSAAGFIGGSGTGDGDYTKMDTYQTINFTNCANYGDINYSNLRPAAGFTAVHGGNITLTNCANFGTITGSTASGLVGNFEGTHGSVELINSYNVGSADGDIAVSDAQGYKAAATFAGWSFGTDWMLTNGYPVPASIFEATAKAQNDKAIVYKGVQYTEANENAFNVRFVATISEETFTAAQKIGYDVVMIEAGKAPVGATFTSDTVYKSLVGYEEDEQVVYNAEEFGGDYLSAIAINNVTASGTVTLIVRPYVLTEAGTQAGIPVACVFTEGALVAQYAY